MPDQVLGPRDRAGLDCHPHGWRALGPGRVAGASRACLGWSIISRLSSLVNASGEAVVSRNERLFLLLCALLGQHYCSLQGNLKDKRLCL